MMIFFLQILSTSAKLFQTNTLPLHIQYLNLLSLNIPSCPFSLFFSSSFLFLFLLWFLFICQPSSRLLWYWWWRWWPWWPPSRWHHHPQPPPSTPCSGWVMKCFLPPCSPPSPFLTLSHSFSLFRTLSHSTTLSHSFSPFLTPHHLSTDKAKGPDGSILEKNFRLGEIFKWELEKEKSKKSSHSIPYNTFCVPDFSRECVWDSFCGFQFSGQ